MVDINSILGEMKRERDRLNGAISALERGRTVNKTPNGRRKGRGRLSAAARKKISEAAKARWAKAKKAGRNSLQRGSTNN